MMEAPGVKRSSIASDDCIRVALRVRPLVASEVALGCRSIVTKTRDTAQVVVNNKDQFTFNYAFSADETQEMIYVNSIKPMVLKLMQGYNVTILAYGQTGSGKTHTMGTAFDPDQPSDEMGLIPRAINEIFDRTESQSETHTFEITCSFIELYQEVLYDLLSPNNREQSVVDIREDHTKSIFIANLTEKVVTSSEGAFNCLMQGSSGRAVGATAMNATSSRSHAIFTVTVRMTCIANPDNATNSKFHLVDLAGSERSNKTKATGQRFKEGVKINQGLLALGNVISTLGSDKGGHVSYRDSKLTRLLQDSLGGNSVTLMIACVSPADYNMDETLSTLRYADRAKQIKNTAVVNMDPKAAEIKRLNAENQQLRLELMEYRSSGVSLSQVANLKKDSKRRQSIVPTDELNQLTAQLTSTAQENVLLNQSLRRVITQLSSISVKYYAAEMANETLMVTMKELTTKVNSLNGSMGADTCPAEFVVQSQTIAELKKLIGQATKDVMANHEVLSYSPRQDRTFCINDTIADEAPSQRDLEFQSRQMEFQEELAEIQEQIRLKTEVSERVAKNSVQFTQLDEALQEKIVDYETKIKDMENELTDLKQSAEEPKKSKAISSKLAEERRKKVLALESEIRAMQKKSQHQEAMLRQQEQYKKQTASVQAELVQMKRIKVELIKKITKSNEEFHKEQKEAKKKIVNLEQQQHKTNSKFMREKMVSQRKEDVLKRKMEEYIAVNKRLKDSLEKCRSAQLQRQRSANITKTTNQSATVQSNVIENEIEMIYLLVDAKQSLNQMLDDRAQLTTRMMALKRQRNISAEDNQTIDALKEDIAMRNAQIEELQDKIKSNDLDDKLKKTADGLTSMAEAKAAVKHLFATLVDLRIAFDDAIYLKQDAVEEVQVLQENLRIANSTWEEKSKELHQECQQMRSAKHEVERAYEEKVAMLLRELNSSVNGVQSEAQRINDEMLEQMEHKLNMAYSRVAELESWSHVTRLAAANTRRGFTEYVDTTESEYDVESEIENQNDPDWVKTPRVPRKLGRARSTTNSTLHTTADHSTHPLEESNTRSRCHCKTDCSKKICGCRKMNAACSEDCRCPDTCKNTVNDGADNNDTFNPNETQVLSTAQRFASPDANKENEHVSPKRPGIDLDPITTPYPYKNKKMMPMLD